MNKLIFLIFSILFALITANNIKSKIMKNTNYQDVKGTGTRAIINGKNYYFSDTTQVSWDEANDSCKDMGMTLLNIETQEENDAIFNFIETDPGTPDVWRWTSGKRIADTTDWIWTGTGEEFTSYTNWGSGQPSAPITTESCCSIAAFYNAWDDDNCLDVLLSFICEDIAPFTTTERTTHLNTPTDPITTTTDKTTDYPSSSSSSTPTSTPSPSPSPSH